MVQHRRLPHRDVRVAPGNYSLLPALSTLSIAGGKVGNETNRVIPSKESIGDPRTLI